MGPCTDCHDDQKITVHFRSKLVQPQIIYLAENVQLTQLTSLGNCLIIIKVRSRLLTDALYQQVVSSVAYMIHMLLEPGCNIPGPSADGIPPHTIYG